MLTLLVMFVVAFLIVGLIAMALGAARTGASFDQNNTTQRGRGSYRSRGL